MVDALSLPGTKAPRLRGAARVLLLATALTCVSACGPTLATLPGIGEPENAPARPEVAPEFPSVFGRSAAEPRKAEDGEAKKVEADLAAAKASMAERRRKMQQGVQ